MKATYLNWEVSRSSSPILKIYVITLMILRDFICDTLKEYISYTNEYGLIGIGI